jgi:site-specific recombinase XerD
VVVLGSFFGWMVNVGYLPSRNPWMLINRRVGDDAGQSLLDSRAFTPEAWAALLAHLQAQPPDASRARMLFILTFVEATGLRASELVGATMGALRQHRGAGCCRCMARGPATVWWRFPGRPGTPCRITCWPAAWVHWDIRRPRHLCWRA